VGTETAVLKHCMGFPLSCERLGVCGSDRRIVADVYHDDVDCSTIVSLASVSWGGGIDT